MSSLQKFHRRTNNAPVIIANDLITVTATMGDGSGDDTKGFYLGGFSDGQKMYVAPKSTEVQLRWGSPGTVRGTTFVNNGLVNTNTLATFGSNYADGHPAAYYCKTLATGGYNTWYMPAKNEVITFYSNKAKTPFATSNGFGGSGSYYHSSSEIPGGESWMQAFGNGNLYNGGKHDVNTIRAVRRSNI